MKDHIVSRKTMARLCAEPSPDDGLDPHSRSRIMPGDRHLHCRSQEGPDRKALQLCHQVAETLEEVLAECGDVVLQALRVLDVEPAPDASRLLVTVAVDATPEAVLDPCSVHDHLVRARPATSAARWQVPSHVSVRRCWFTVWRQTRTPSVIDGNSESWREVCFPRLSLVAVQPTITRPGWPSVLGSSIMIGRSRKAPMVAALVRRWSVVWLTVYMERPSASARGRRI